MKPESPSPYPQVPATLIVSLDNKKGTLLKDFFASLYNKVMVASFNLTTQNIY
jgi:hypothetical protein